jgi:hypothetical protein
MTWTPISIEKIDFNKLPTNEELVSYAIHVTEKRGWNFVGEIEFVEKSEDFEECLFRVNTEDFSTGFINFSGGYVNLESLGALFELWRNSQKEDE